MAIIRGENHTSYREALLYLNLKSLEDRREAICLKFALRAYRHPKFTLWFTRNVNTVNTRSTKTPLVKIKGRTKRYRSSPLPYLNGLLNKHLMLKSNPDAEARVPKR